MSHLTVAKVNAAISKAGIAHVEFVRGEGYCYFIFDDGKRYDSHSVYVPYVSDLPLDRWLDEARQCAALATA